MADLIDVRHRAPIGAALALVALALLSGGAGPIAVGVLAALGGLAIASAVLLRGDGGLRVGGAALAVLAALTALSALSALSLEWGGDDGAGFRDLVLALAYAGIFALLLAVVRPGSTGGWVGAIAFAGVLVSALSLGDRLLGIDGWDGEIASALPAAEDRLSGPLGYWNALGSLAAVSVPALLWLAARGRGRSRGLAVAAVSLPVAAIVLAGSRGGALAALLGAALCVAFAVDRRLMARLTALAAAIALAASGLVALIDDGPSGADLSAPGSSVDAGLIRGSDSGRLKFWEAAIDAFASDPLRGVGAGGYAGWWGENGAGRVPIQNAHSGPLESFAELGLAGGLLALAVVAVPLLTGAGRARSERRRALRAGPPDRDRPGLGTAGGALAIFASAAIGHLFDWTAEVPAAFLPLLIAAALLTGNALVREGRTARLPALPRIATGVSVIAAAVAVWAGIVLAVSARGLAEGREALAEGRPTEAARQVRTAVALQPWSAEPHRLLAEIELGASNFGAALRQARAAVRLAPVDFRNWHVAGVAGDELGEDDLAAAYAARARELAPARSNLDE